MLEGVAKLVDHLEKPDENLPFRLKEVRELSIPHPFMVTPKHVAFAADNRGGMLSKEAIRDSGVPCGMQGCQLFIDEHDVQVTAIIELDEKPQALSTVEGLQDYLMLIKDTAEAIGIEAFAFPHRS